MAPYLLFLAKFHALPMSYVITLKFITLNCLLYGNGMNISWMVKL